MPSLTVSLYNVVDIAAPELLYNICDDFGIENMHAVLNEYSKSVYI